MCIRDSHIVDPTLQQYVLANVFVPISVLLCVLFHAYILLFVILCQAEILFMIPLLLIVSHPVISVFFFLSYGVLVSLLLLPSVIIVPPFAVAALGKFASFDYFPFFFSITTNKTSTKCLLFLLLQDLFHFRPKCYDSLSVVLSVETLTDTR